MVLHTFKSGVVVIRDQASSDEAVAARILKHLTESDVGYISSSQLAKANNLSVTLAREQAGDSSTPLPPPTPRHSDFFRVPL